MFSRVRNPFLTLLLSYHVLVTSKIRVNFRYRRYLRVLMIVSYKFLKFLHYLCFRGQGIHFWYSYWATMFGWPRKSRSTSGTGGTWRYWWLCLINFWNFFTIYVFEVREFISDILTELPCSGDLENQGQLPVQKVLEGTDDFVLWIFTISSVFIISRSRNSLPTFSVSCYVWVTSKIQVNFRYKRYSKVLMIVSYRFLKFLHYLCFWGQGIHCRHSYWATMFGWPWKSRSTSGSVETDDSVL